MATRFVISAEEAEIVRDLWPDEEKAEGMPYMNGVLLTVPKSAAPLMVRSIYKANTDVQGSTHFDACLRLLSRITKRFPEAVFPGEEEAEIERGEEKPLDEADEFDHIDDEDENEIETV